MAQTASPRNVIIYADQNGSEPFSEWLHGVRDAGTRRRILTRLRRVEQGNYGDYRSLHDGIYELRFAFGPGYRVYFGEDRDAVVVLLMGGDKGSQHKDIDRANAYWKEYKTHA